jgi:hypothetical protein
MNILKIIIKLYTELSKEEKILILNKENNTQILN